MLMDNIMNFLKLKATSEYYRHINDDITNHHDKYASDINLYLFFDLYQVCQDILAGTDENDHIILIGDTPSYLKPFLEFGRKTYNFALSNKAFGCFDPPHSLPFDNSKFKSINNKMITIKSVFTPSKRQLNSYFDYLDNTPLNRNFIRDNWYNIVLVDSSSGQSIHGASIFFNRYVGNIQEEISDIDCTNIQGAEPLRFISIGGSGRTATINIKPQKSELLFKNKKGIRNFDPKLIIVQGEIAFSHRELFLIYEYFPRYVAAYSIRQWEEDPPNCTNNTDLQKGCKFIDKIQNIYELCLTYETNMDDAIKLSEIIRSLPHMSDTDIESLKNPHGKLIHNIKNFSPE